MCECEYEYEYTQESEHLLVLVLQCTRSRVEDFASLHVLVLVLALVLTRVSPSARQRRCGPRPVSVELNKRLVVRRYDATPPSPSLTAKAAILVAVDQEESSS